MNLPTVLPCRAGGARQEGDLVQASVADRSGANVGPSFVFTYPQYLPSTTGCINPDGSSVSTGSLNSAEKEALP